MPIDNQLLIAVGAALAGLALLAYVVRQWRRAARACYPMPFRRRRSYISGFLFSVGVMAVPGIVTVAGVYPAFHG